MYIGVKYDFVNRGIIFISDRGNSPHLYPRTPGGGKAL